jgi:O-antigen/teichoic acid export membrane protein
MIPKVSELQRDGNTREILFLFARTMRKLAAFYLPVAALLILNAREIVVLLFTEQYVESVPLFAVNAALIPLVAIAIGADAVIRAYAEHRYYVIHVRAVLTVLLVAGLIFAVDRFGLMGVVLVVAGTETLERIVLAAKTGSILGMTRADLPLFKDVGKIGLATALGAAVTLPVHSALSWLGVFPILLLESAVFSSVYVAALFALGVVTREEVDALKSQMERARRRLPGRAETVPIAQVRAE